MENDYGNRLVKQASNASLLNDSVKGQGGADLSPSSHAGYRPDIDGLRAVAVLAVVFYHAFPRIVRGGYSGVDVFFVISGFLISGIIFDALAAGKFSFIDFYARRIRRIFPALATVLIAALTFGWFTLFSDEYAALGKHTAGGAGFCANILSWLESGDYWATASEKQPLLHLWSLGVEEQFYLLIPALIFVLWRCGVRLLTVFGVLFAASFVFNLLMRIDHAAFNFYFPATRFWEILAQQQGHREAISRIVGAKIVDSLDVFCPRDECVVFDEAGNIMYIDKHHFSLYGAEYQVRKQLAKYLEFPAGE